MARGGRRKGAGRPKGTGKFGEPTKAVRLSVSKIDRIIQFIERNTDVYPVYPGGETVGEVVQCALSDELIAHSAATFMVRVADDAMEGAGILAHDLLIADRSQEPGHGDIVIIALNETLLARRLSIKNKKTEFKAENPNFKTVHADRSDEIEIWGVVATIIRHI